MSDKFDTSTVLLGEGGGTEAGSSATKDLLACWKRYQYKYVRGIIIPQAEQIAPFAVGNIVAAMRREWFAAGFDTSKKVMTRLSRAAQKEAEREKLPINPRDEIFARALMEQYIAYWKVRPYPTPVQVEYKLGPGPLWKGAPFQFYRTARPDDISRYPEAGGALCLADAKTTSGDIGTTIREYELHVQPLQYLALYRLDPQGEKRFGKLAGLVLDVIKKPSQGKKPQFQRAFIEYRDEAVDQFVESMRFHLEAQNKIGWDTPVPRDYACTYMAGRARVDCEYKDLCRMGRAAVARYKMNDGSSLKKYKPKPGAEKFPWE